MHIIATEQSFLVFWVQRLGLKSIVVWFGLLVKLRINMVSGLYALRKIPMYEMLMYEMPWTFVFEVLG